MRLEYKPFRRGWGEVIRACRRVVVISPSPLCTVVEHRDDEVCGVFRVKYCDLIKTRIFRTLPGRSLVIIEGREMPTMTHNELKKLSAVYLLLFRRLL